MVAVAATFHEASEPPERVPQRQCRRKQVRHPPVGNAVPPRIPDGDNDRANKAAVENEPASQRVEAVAVVVAQEIMPVGDEVEQLATQHAEDEQVERQVKDQLRGDVLLAGAPSRHPDAREKTAGDEDAIPVDDKTAELDRNRMHDVYLAECRARRKGDRCFFIPVASDRMPMIHLSRRMDCHQSHIVILVRAATMGQQRIHQSIAGRLRFGTG